MSDQPRTAREKLAVLHYRGGGDWRMPDGTALDAEEVRELQATVKDDDLTAARAEIERLREELAEHQRQMAMVRSREGRAAIEIRRLRKERDEAREQAQSAARQEGA